MRILDPSTPVVVLRCGLGGLAIMRHLGNQGIELCGVDGDPKAPGMLSRYCRHKVYENLDPARPAALLETLLKLGRRFGRAVLIPTADDSSEFVAQNAAALEESYAFQDNDAGLVASLVSKRGMYKITQEHAIPTARTSFPQDLGDVEAVLPEITFPVMLKGIDGLRLKARAGTKMAIVASQDELLRLYREHEDPENPNLMIQEYIPGNDTDVYIYNGYFDKNSDPLVGFTGKKLRQYPIHMGVASLGICKWYQRVADVTEDFMKRIGYTGVLDIGWRYDRRDDQFKVLDVNPRVGQAFRVFVGTNDMDSVRALYLDLTGQEVEATVPCEGRRWVIEDQDLIASLCYRKEGTLGFWRWLRSYRDVQECAWFDRRDPRPFVSMARRVLLQAAGRTWGAILRGRPLVRPSEVGVADAAS